MSVASVLEQKSAPAAGVAKRIPGEAGAWVFILGDMCVFAVFFCVYLVKRAEQPELFAHAQGTLNRNLGALNTLILLVSSLFVVLALHAMRTGENRHRARALIVAAMGCGLGFIVVKAFEYHEKIAAGVTPATNDFYMYYFVLTGIHLLHLVIALVVLATMWALSRKGELSGYRWAFVEAGACFWHMVDLLWIVLFPLLFLAR